MIMMFMNLAIIMYIAAVKPFYISFLNRVELMNEAMIMLTTINYLFFTDWVPSLDD